MAIDTTIPAFPFMPDWSAVVKESLQFKTDAIQAMDGSEQTRRDRMTPRRLFEFQVAEEKGTRQGLANLAYARTSDLLYLPLWTEGALLEASLPSGSDLVPVNVAMLDFAAGNVAMLRGQTPDQVELVEVLAIGDGYVQLAAPTAKPWGIGTDLLPVRLARFDTDFAVAAFNRSLTYGTIRLAVAEPNPYASEAPATIYRGFPVLDTRPSYAKDPETEFSGMAYTVDDDVSIPAKHDEVGIPLYRQAHDWNLDGRAQLVAFRKLVYALRGKQKSLWVPTWLDDLTLVATTASGSAALVVAWCGYTAHIAQAVNRRDLRIELADGTVLYRRINASVDNGNGTETLTMDSAPGVALTVANVAQVSFMGLCRSDSDNFELGWWTRDYADVSTAWRARQHDV